MSLWYLHRSGLVWSASTSCPPRPPRSPAPSSSGRSRRARSRWRTEHWAHSNIPILKQKMYFSLMSDAKYVSLYFRCKSLSFFGKFEFLAGHGGGESGGVSLSLVLTSWNLIYRARWFLRANINFYFVWSSTALFSPSPGLKRRKVEVTLIFHAWLAT